MAESGDRTRVGALDREAVAHLRTCPACQERFAALMFRPQASPAWWIEPPEYCPRCGRNVTVAQQKGG